MVDRRFLGFVLIIIVVTSIISALVFQAAADEYVRFLSSRIPDDIPGGTPGSPSYSMDILAVRDLPDLVVKFHFLVNLTAVPLLRPWNETTQRGFTDLVANVPLIQGLIEELDRLKVLLNLDSTYEVYDLEMPDRVLHVIDFSDSITNLAGEESLRTIYTVYALSVNDDDVVSVLGGYRDFFAYRGDFTTTGYNIITEVSYRGPSGSACFRSEEAAGVVGGCAPLSEAPVGVVWMKDLAADQSIHVEVTLNTNRMFGHNGILQIVTTETGYGTGPALARRIGARGT